MGGGWLDRLVRLGATQPLREPVASDDAFYLASKGRLKIASRTLRRMGELMLSGQRPFFHHTIDPAWKRALWIHEEAPQIGDALMDLAARSLLTERGFEVDLFAAPPIAHLFSGDRHFTRCVSDPGELLPDRYDFVVATSHSAASLAVKRSRLPRLPWVSLKAWYTGYDYHRAEFTARRLADLVGIELDKRALTVHARQKLDGPPVASPLPPASPDEWCVAIALGGVRDERRYPHWPAVVDAWFATGRRPALALIGSANGKAAAAEVKAAVPRGAVVHDFVDRLDLRATRAVIDASHRLYCADGGLMHLGLTTRTPMVALFTSNIDPAWRLPRDFEGSCLRAPGLFVGAIDPGAVAAA